MAKTDMDSIQALLDEYKKKTYTELLAMPVRVQLDVAGFSEESTVEFSRELDENQTLTINLKLHLWQSQEQKETQDRWVQELMQHGEDEDEDDEESFDDLIESMIASGELEEAIPPLPHKHRNDLIFSGSSFHHYFNVKADGTLIEDEYTQNEKAEDALIEEADWFGKTGLDENWERSLPRYLRTEFGEFVLDDDYLKASDLIYLGHIKLTAEDYNDENGFSEDIESLQMWKIPRSDCDEQTSYAFVAIEDGYPVLMGIIDYCPDLKNRLN